MILQQQLLDISKLVLKEGGNNSADLFAGCKGFQPNKSKRLLHLLENNETYTPKIDLPIGSIIHRNWDSKLVNLVADYWKNLGWENNREETDTGDKFHLSFYEMVIDIEINYGISLPSLKNNGHPSWDNQEYTCGNTDSTLKARTKLFVAVSTRLQEKKR